MRLRGVISICVAIALSISGLVAPATAIGGFGDVASQRYYSSAVQWMVDRQITTGTAAGCFAPDQVLTRAELATFVWRYAGEPAGGGHPFGDVGAGSYYETAVGWMYRTGLTTGTSRNTYSPHRAVTRGEMAAFLWRYAGSPSRAAAVFSDVASTDFYRDAVSWMVAEGITNGTSTSTFSPDQGLTRAQFATFLYRYEGQPSVVDSGGGYCVLSGQSTLAGDGYSDGTSNYQQAWAFNATFDGDPSAPAPPSSQFEYAVTHRVHPAELQNSPGTYQGEHTSTCAPPPATHTITAMTNGRETDPAFYRCKNHQMTALGDVSGYSLASWWPRQEYNFADGGVLELDVNPSPLGGRMWWEVMLAPRADTRLAAARPTLPIDETYPAEYVLYRYKGGQMSIEVNGAVCSDWRTFGESMGNVDDPAITDTKIRRQFRLLVEPNGIPAMEVELDDGRFARLDFGSGDSGCSTPSPVVTIDQALPVFKHHAYTPDKDGGNGGRYTMHWDNIRFDGPQVGHYTTTHINDLVYLSANGDRPVGSSQTVNVNLSATGPNAQLFGQIHAPKVGGVLVRVNGGPVREVTDWTAMGGECASEHWTTFHLPLSPGELRVGNNTFEFIVGENDPCVASWMWTGFSAKTLEVQFG